MGELGEQVSGVVHVLRRPPHRASPPADDAVLAPVCSEDFSPPLQTQLLVLQPTPFCNINCRYCYLPARDLTARMAPSTVRLAARRLRDDGLVGREITIVWHAGEPLVLPPAWYEQTFALIAEELGPAVQVQHAMQTNATLIDAAWCRFFDRHAVQLGVSVDGPANWHDLQRIDRQGRGTHARVLAGLALLHAEAVPFHAIAVVGAATLRDPDRFYDWFAAQGIHEVACNVDEAEGAHRRSSLAGHEAAHARFMQRLLARALHGPVQVRELSAAWQLLRAPLPRWHWQQQRWPHNSQVQPLALISVAHDGSFCTFSPELLGQHWPAYNGFELGNVHTGSYRAALQTPLFARLWRDISAGVSACQQHCAYFEQCGGGAPVNKLYEHGSFAATETLYCRSMVQRPFDAVLQHVEQLQQEPVA